MKSKCEPIEIDAHLKYNCSNCESSHWISIKAAKTPDYFIVCDVCGEKIQVKTISNVAIEYSETFKPETSPDFDNVIKIAIRSLKDYGYPLMLCKQVVKEAYEEYPTDDAAILMKNATKIIGKIKLMEESAV